MKKILATIAILAVLGAGYYCYTRYMPIGVVEAPTEEESGAQGKLDINVVCESALAYMTFEAGESSAQFLADCKEGKHPEVIERYKADMGYGDGRAI